MHRWTAEITVDEAFARRLIGRQFPRLEVDELRLVGAGWDNTVWLVDGQWAFRFPRRQIAIPGVEREIGVLPALAPLLPLPVPTPSFVGRPGDGYPWPFFGAPYLPGRELCDVALSDDTRASLAAPLGAFLSALHSAHVPGAEVLPTDPNRRGDMPFRVTRTRDALDEAERLGLWHAPPCVGGLLVEAVKLPAAEPSALTHGDLHFRHLLLDAEGRLTGVIDWGDLCRADPSIDLSVHWSTIPPVARSKLLAAYGPVSEAQLLRARVLALSLGLMLAVYARHEGLGNVEREAIAGLDRTMAD